MQTDCSSSEGHGSTELLSLACGQAEADTHSSVSSQIRWKTLHTPPLISQMKDYPKFPGGAVGDNMVLCKQKCYLQGNISQGLATLKTACGALSL